MKDLLRAVKNRLTLVKEFDGVRITIQPSARFDALVEGEPEVDITPSTVLYDCEARDVVKETSTVSVAIAVYFADNFNEGTAYNLLELAPAVERAFLGVDLRVGDDTLYRWVSSNTLATPFNNVIKDIPGGVLDANAADEAYTFQVVVLLTYSRYLKMNQLPSVTLRDLPSRVKESPEAIVADETLRLTLTVTTEDKIDATAELYTAGVLSFATL